MAAKLGLGFFSSLTKKESLNEGACRRRDSSLTGSDGVTKSLSSLHADIDNVLRDDDSVDSGYVSRSNSFENNNKSSRFIRIKKSHWKDSSKAHTCARCLEVFKLTSKRINCRRCGEVFCEICCQYKRKLSPECIPDPQGNIYRVCYVCADLHSQPFGATRTLTSQFREQRKNKRVNLLDELSRLVHGFQHNVDPSSRIKTAVTDVFTIKVPEWQKSHKWQEGSDGDWCNKCLTKFTLFTKKSHCRVCGSVFCGKCCKPDLLLYYEDNVKVQKAKAALIGIVGCPDKEPSVSIYLPICQLCNVVFEEYQVQKYYYEASEQEKELKQNLKDVDTTLEKLKVIEKKLDGALPKYEELVEVYIFEGRTNENLNGQNNVEFFAKLQSDISDIFTQYAVVIKGLKQYELSTKTELKIMKNVISIKCRQYNHSMNLFKSLKDNLDKSLPAKALEKFQNYANIRAINNTYVTTRQLGYEALNLASKYNFQPVLAEKLSEIDQTCYEELKTYMKCSDDEWEEHASLLKVLLKEQLQMKKLVSPNQTLSESDGKHYIYHFLTERTSTVLYQVLRALKAKSSDTRFKKTKDSLQALYNEVSECAMKQGRYRPLHGRSFTIG